MARDQDRHGELEPSLFVADQAATAKTATTELEV
jgi:hypothetical protein